MMKDLIRKILKEDNDFDWIKQSEPISREEISKNLSGLAHDYGYNQYDGNLTNVIHQLGLNKEQLESLYGIIYSLGEVVYQNGVDIGWGEGYSSGEQEGRAGYDEAYNDAYDDAKQSVYNEAYNEGYDEGYNDGIEEGYKKGYEEGSEKTYYKAFEEGRAYEVGLDTEEYEKRQSGFDPIDYDDDYDENY